ncbi:bifunctional diguanylate cyclase/phosphodiesterase [Thiohalophilus sp.]|uniref:putative bifunctional diguanylate cyclase/phosphodiesterase n=1 Tax=Thiohalophilus sp. TaxID=3028392 RepID=UPI002ACD360D|nr:bifunctional diguanylate cyclase/phosphodiesterase [Thiohalophilus sp.]MDZ7660808.1 bifunctional diguanylate cyclase/phosphodiesterase [Thiohalophilus sp.]
MGRKLFLGFIGISLLGITLFGYITYQTAHQTRIEELTKSTVDNAAQLATILGGSDPDKARELLQNLQSRQQVLAYNLFIVDRQQAVIFNTLPKEMAAGLTRSLPNSSDNTGRTELGNLYLLWSRQSVPDSELTLYILRQVQKSGFIPFLKSAGIPLAIASLILLWLAFWCAMILGSLYQRLDQQRRELEYQTLHDSLTGLLNRTSLVDQTELRLQRPLSEGECIALLIIDIKRLKEINDTLGHYAGDALLRLIAERLHDVIRENDILARIVSNEFAILLDGVSEESVLAATTRIQEALSEGYEIEGHKFYLGASIGVAFYPEHALDAINLIRHGEMAMYAAKRIGTDITIYDETHKTSTLEQLKLVSDLRTDLENKNIKLYFQPKVNLESGQTVSLEALARWEHPDHGYIATSRFIHIAENTGLINQLTYWVMEQALKRSRQLQDQGKSLNIAINLSMWNLQDLELVDYLQSLIDKYRVEPSRITLEITETAMMVNHKRALHTLHRLHELGVILSIDDFGTGYSSMTYLKQLPLGEVKIDKSFIKSIHQKPSDSSMVRAIIDLAHNLGLTVVGEGVENRQIAEILRELGCDQGQGSYYADAMPFDELLGWLEN